MTEDEKLKEIVSSYRQCSVVEQKFDHYGLPVFFDGTANYAIGTDEQATASAREYIRKNPWSLDAKLIISHTRKPDSVPLVELVESLQTNPFMEETANDLIEVLPDDLEACIEEAIKTDGRGRFLNYYDGEEYVIEHDGEKFFMYRLG